MALTSLRWFLDDEEDVPVAVDLLVPVFISGDISLRCEVVSLRELPEELARKECDLTSSAFLLLAEAFDFLARVKVGFMGDLLR